MKTRSRPFKDSFQFFRRVWGPRASYHLARARYSTEWTERLISCGWLMAERVPFSGAAPSLQFRGLP